MSSFFGFTTNPSVSILFNGEKTRPVKKMKQLGQQAEEIVVYSGQETISGTIEVGVPIGKKIEHLGIKIEMIGQIGKPPV